MYVIARTFDTKAGRAALAVPLSILLLVVPAIPAAGASAGGNLQQHNRGPIAGAIEASRTAQARAAGNLIDGTASRAAGAPTSSYDNSGAVNAALDLGRTGSAAHVGGNVALTVPAYDIDRVQQANRRRTRRMSKPSADRLVAERANVAAARGAVHIWTQGDSPRRVVVRNSRDVDRTGTCARGADCSMPAVTAGTLVLIPRRARGTIWIYAFNSGDVHFEAHGRNCTAPVAVGGNVVIQDARSTATVNVHAVNHGSVDASLQCR